MTSEYGCTIDAARKRTGSPVALTLLLGLVLALSGSAATAGDPVPGIDIVLEQQPGGIRVATTVPDKSGRFTLHVKRPGNYTISITCRQKGARLPTVSITAAGKPLKPSASGAGTCRYNFFEAWPCVLNGQVTSAPGATGAGPVKPIGDNLGGGMGGVATKK